MKISFGKHKGKELSEIPMEYLFWLVENTDTSDAKYGAKNKLLVEACNNEINRRGSSKPAQAPNLSYTPLQRQKTDTLITDLKQHIQGLYDSVMALQSIVDIYTEKNGITTKSSEHSPY